MFRVPHQRRKGTATCFSGVSHKQIDLLGEVMLPVCEGHSNFGGWIIWETMRQRSQQFALRGKQQRVRNLDLHNCFSGLSLVIEIRTNGDEKDDRYSFGISDWANPSISQERRPLRAQPLLLGSGQGNTVCHVGSDAISVGRGRGEIQSGSQGDDPQPVSDEMLLHNFSVSGSLWLHSTTPSHPLTILRATSSHTATQRFEYA